MVLTDWPPIVRIRTYQNAAGVMGILGSVEESLKEKDGSERAVELLQELLARLGPIKERFASPGIEEGDFTQVFPFLQENRDHVGREGIYPDILSKLYGFYETTGEIDSMASGWLEEELPLIMQEARFVPNMVNGRVSGFRITGLPTKSIISQIGIRRNDIVKKINDVELDSVEGMLDLYMKFKDESRFEVTIERSGKTIRIMYTLR